MPYNKIHRLPIPTPYPIGDVYAYLILEDPITLIDVGVATEEARCVWERHLKNLKLTVKDIRRIILTHGHSDHYGLAREFAEAAGIKIKLHPLDWEKVKDRKAFYEKMLPYIGEFGIPQKYLDTFIKVLLWERNFCLDIPEDMLDPVDEGSIIEFEHFSLTVRHVPGHSPGHIILKKEDWAITGDFIFHSFTPIPVIEIETGTRKKTALMYRDSLSRMKEEGLYRYIPSHREFEGIYPEALENMKARVHHKERLILEIMGEDEHTPYDIICSLYPDHKPSDIYVLASEVIGRLDLMEEKGLIESRKKNGVIYYRRKRQARRPAPAIYST